MKKLIATILISFCFTVGIFSCMTSETPNTAPVADSTSCDSVAVDSTKVDSLKK